MADPVSRDAGFTVETGLEFKKAKAANESAADEVGAPGTPSPKLRADKIDIADSASFQRTRETKMKAREVRQYGESWFTSTRFSAKRGDSAPQRRNFVQHFDNAKRVDVGRFDDKFYTGFTHERSAHAEKMQVRASRAESDSQFGGIHIAGSFAGGNENFGRDLEDLRASYRTVRSAGMRSSGVSNAERN